MPTNFDRAALETTGVYTVPVSYSTLSLFDTISHKDQIEVYRPSIESRYNTEFDPDIVLTRDEKTIFGIIQPDWITYNETNKTITAISLPASTYSFTRDNGTVIYYPAMVAGESLEIRRKMVSIDILTKWVTGSRLTADQLNLIGSQLIGLGQENKFDLEENVLKFSDQNIEYTTPDYVTDAIGTLTGLISLPSGVDNSVDHDDELIVLDRVSSVNVPTAATKLKWDNVESKIKLVGKATQTTNRLEMLASDGTTLINFFNPRGVLNVSGRVYYGGTTPSPNPNASDTGLLWWDTSTAQVLKVWDGAAWVALTIGAGSFVTLDTTQSVTGLKTFQAAVSIESGLTMTNSNLSLTSAGVIQGSGASKSLIFKPTNSSSVATLALTLAATTVTVDPLCTLEATLLGTTITNQVGMLASTQTFTGLKTFENTLLVKPLTGGSATSNISTHSGSASTDGTTVKLRSNMATNSRAITIFNEADSSVNGITISPKGMLGGAAGTLVVDGPTTFNNDVRTITNARYRNLKDSRIPGSYMTFRKIANTNTLTLIPSAGLESFPEATVACTVLAGGNVQVVITKLLSTTPEQKYRITYEQHHVSTYTTTSIVVFPAVVGDDVITLTTTTPSTWSLATVHPTSADYDRTNAHTMITVTCLY